MKKGAQRDFLLSNVKDLNQPKISYDGKPQFIMLQNSQTGQINLNSKATCNCYWQSHNKSILNMNLEFHKAGNTFSLSFHTACTYTKPAVICLLLGAEAAALERPREFAPVALLLSKCCRHSKSAPSCLMLFCC